VNEPLFNVGMVCKDHAPKPGRFAGMKPHTFVGKLVKLGFPATNPQTNKETTEHMWVKVTQQLEVGIYSTGEELVGTLENDPFLICEYENGDEVAFKVEEIEDVYTDGDS
jgi:uncharacterized protein YegJ (DUF2314 family)